MQVTSRIYLDAALQNIKSVTFFTFLQVLIVRLGASNFQVSLSNSLPAIFCALSLAFLTRQMPVTRTVYLVGGYVRQFAFLGMALSILLPNPFPVLFVLWAVNATAVMVTSAQQPAILRRWVEPSAFPGIFSRNKVIGIAIMTAGSFLIGSVLDATDGFFPNNYVVSMLVGCLSTFAGMALIAGLAPRERFALRLKPVRPFRETDGMMWWMALNNMGIFMAAPLFVIYHVKMLGLTNTQISYFVVVGGIVSALALPIVRRAMDRFGIRKVYSLAVLLLAVSIIPYGLVHHFGWLLLMQGCVVLCTAVHEVANQSLMMEHASEHADEMAYFSDFQLIMQLGQAIGPLLAAALLHTLPMWACFILIAALRIGFFCTRRMFEAPRAGRPHARPLQTAK